MTGTAATADPTGRRGSAGGRGQLLWCAECGREVPCRPEESLRFAESGWPRCCGEVMSLAVGPHRPVSR